MKKLYFTKYAILGMITLLFFSACKKDYVDPLGDGGQKTIGFLTYGGKTAAASGVTALSLDLSLPKDSLQVQLLYSTPQVSDKDIIVTVSYDAAKLAAFNAAQPAGGIIYAPLTGTQYMLKTTQVKIRAGQTLSDPFFVIFYPNQLDAAKSYLLTLGITKIEGAPSDVKPASGTGTAYFRIIGNPLAGAYTTTGMRYNYSGGVIWPGPPAPFPAGFTNGTTAAYNSVVTASAIDAQTVQIIPFGNVPEPAPVGGSASYYITGNASFSMITFTQGANFDLGYSNVQRYVLDYSFIGTGSAASPKPTFRLITKYNNAPGGAGNDRIIDQTYTHN